MRGCSVEEKSELWIGRYVGWIWWGGGLLLLCGECVRSLGRRWLIGRDVEEVLL